MLYFSNITNAVANILVSTLCSSIGEGTECGKKKEEFSNCHCDFHSVVQIKLFFFFLSVKAQCIPFAKYVEKEKKKLKKENSLWVYFNNNKTSILFETVFRL